MNANGVVIQFLIELTDSQRPTISKLSERAVMVGTKYEIVDQIAIQRQTKLVAFDLWIKNANEMHK